MEGRVEPGTHCLRMRENLRNRASKRVRERTLSHGESLGTRLVGGWSSSAVSKLAFVVALLGILTIKCKATNTGTLPSLSLFPFLVP